MPKCAMFKHGMTINTRGKVKPCCSFDHLNNDDYTISETELWQKQFAEYDKLMQDDWIPQCIDCKILEKDGGSSLRTRSNEYYKKSSGLKYWDLKISNTCNLMCRMCSPSDSSKWVQNLKNYKELEWTYTPSQYENKKYSWHDTDLPLVKELLNDIDILKFTGGEPMLVKHVKEIIDHLINTGVSKNTTLHLTSNATVPFVDYWEDLIPKFKNVRVRNSIDAIGSRYEYIRAGANWEEVERNIIHQLNLKNKYSNFDTFVDCTAQALNACCIDDIKTWAKNLEIDFVSSTLRHPSYMSYASLDETLRIRYNVDSDVPFDPAQLQQLKTQMSYIDKIYGTDFKTECPEFFE